jgi:hypothetical protein
LRIQSEDFELPTPFSGSVAEPFDTNAAWQTTFDRGFDEVRCEERERNRHIDLTHTAFLAYLDLLDANHRARHDLVKPATASGSRTERFELSELREGGLTC